MNILGKEYADIAQNKKQNKRTGILRILKAYMKYNRLGDLLVLKGLITPQDLRFALHQQKQTRKPLGQIFLKHAIISRRQLALVLGRQMVLRSLAACIFFVAALTHSGKKARAEINDVPAKISISAGEEFARVASYPALFGSDEKRSANLAPFTKWTGMFSRFERELQGTGGGKIVKDLQDELQSFKGLSLKTMASRVNNLMNETPYILDSRNWGQSDYWATPVEFLQRGGDCEDFAIAKYASLRALGFSGEQMRIAIVQDKIKNIPHAVLVVYTDDDVYILDNQNKSLVDASGAGRYRPIFSINRQAWWLHTAPGSSTVVASAQ